MDAFPIRNGVMHAEDVALPAIAEAVGTPVYVYSLAKLVAKARAFRAGLAALDAPHLAFAVKANPNLAVLRALGREGYGADVVSGGELTRALELAMRAKGVRPRRAALSSVITMTAAAPSFRPDALAAVTDPSLVKAGRSFCIASIVAPWRMYSSLSTTVPPLRVLTV